MKERLSTTSAEFDKKFKKLKAELKKETDSQIRKEITLRFKEERKRYYGKETIDLKIEMAKLDSYSELEEKFNFIMNELAIIRMDILNFKEEILSRIIKVEDKLDGLQSLYFRHDEILQRHEKDIQRLNRKVL